MKQLGRTFLLLTFMVGFLYADQLFAQTNLTADGAVYRIDRNAGYQDFIIPSIDPDTDYNQIDFYLRGGDGGRRKVGILCTEPGGEGATVIASFEIGVGGGKLRPGGTIRFILGQKGEGINSSGIVGAGGGGGSAILYKPPGLTLNNNPQNNSCYQSFYNDSNDGVLTYKDVPSHTWNTRCWILLMVAGGGGGAYAPGGCAQPSSGKGGNDAEGGSNGKGDLGSAGKGGENGDPGNDHVGSGGGGTTLREFDGSKGEAGTLTEGRGGTSDGITRTRAGDGYGGGGSGLRGVGGGGGGGGYSGGGGGGAYDGGGGGGSFFNSRATDASKQKGGTDSTPDDGFVTYQFDFDADLVDPPVALCQDIIVTVDQGQDVSITTADVDTGSSDPNDRPITLSICSVCDPADTNCTPICSQSATWNCGNAGRTYSRTLQVDNGYQTASCNFTIEVVGGTPTPISCPADIRVDADPGTCTKELEDVLYPENLGACDGELSFQIQTPSGAPATPVSTRKLGIISNEFEVGVSTITYEFVAAVDGSTSSCSFSVRVDDPDASFTSCPSNITVVADPGECSATLTGELAVAWESPCNAPLTYEIKEPSIEVLGQGLISSHTFPIGRSEVSYSLSESVVCTFNVVVKDEEAPVPQVDPLPIVSGISPVAVFQPSATDNCGILIRGTTTDPVYYSAPGSYTINWTYDDGRGNTSTQTQQVVVTALSCPPDVEATTTDNSCRALVENIAATISGLNGGYTLTTLSSTITAASYPATDPTQDRSTTSEINHAYFQVGISTLTYELVIDGAPSETCSTTIIVKDADSFSAVCKEVEIFLDENGEAAISLSDVLADADSQCSIISSAISQTDFSCSDLGLTEPVVSIRNLFGESAECTAKVTLSDNLKPQVVCPANVSVDLPAGACTATISEGLEPTSFSDNCTVQTIAYRLEGPGGFLLTGLNQGFIPEVDLAPGVYAGEYQMEDQSNNLGKCSFEISVFDPHVPLAQCQDIEVDADETGAASITPEQIDAGSSDNCAVASLSLDQTEFNCQSGGGGTVTLTVADAAGNSSSCEAGVTLRDNIAPAVNCKDATIYLDASGEATLTPADIDEGSSDNCGIADWSLSRAAFNCSNIGAPLVELTITDNAGVSASCVATVTVLDNRRPSAVCKDATLYLNASGEATLSSTDIDGGSSDNCGIVGGNLSRIFFTCSDIGDHFVKSTVFDNAGNSTPCIATVTVLDNRRPLAACKDATIYLDGSGEATLAPADIDAGSSDNCGGVSRDLDVNSFTCADEGVNTVTLTLNDASGNISSCLATVTVIGEIRIDLKPGARLWPPDYAYQTFTISDMAEGLGGLCGDGSLDGIWIAGATSDEAEDDPGTQDGNTLNDMVIGADCQSIQIRRERMGGGNGRVYTVTLAVSDAAGNISYADFKVQIPKWAWGWNSDAVEDEAMYTLSCGATAVTSASLSEAVPIVGDNFSDKRLQAEHISLSIYPNPFYDQTSINFYLPEAAFATVEIFNVQGQMIKQLYAGQMDAGQRQLIWKGVDSGGRSMPSGLYLARMTIGENVLVKKISRHMD